MVVQITKKKVEAEVASAVLLSDFAATIDEVGTLTAQIEKVQADIVEKTKKEQEKLTGLQKKLAPLLKSLGEQLNAAHAEDDPDQTFVESGEKFQAEIGKKGNARKITDIKLVKDLMGEDTFFALCKVNLKDIDDYLNPQEREAVLETERTKREVKIVKRV